MIIILPILLCYILSSIKNLKKFFITFHQIAKSNHQHHEPPSSKNCCTSRNDSNWYWKNDLFHGVHNLQAKNIVAKDVCGLFWSNRFCVGKMLEPHQWGRTGKEPGDFLPRSSLDVYVSEAIFFRGRPSCNMRSDPEDISHADQEGDERD